MKRNSEDILELTRAFFTHQGELYGRELILSHSDSMADVSASNGLEAYRRSIQECQKCSLARTRKHFVFGAGNPDAQLMLIGEAPGREEDLQGEPFVGQAGQLLDKILAAIGFQREEVFIGNVLKCRPPQNRDPLPEEIVLCMPYLLEQVSIIQPKMILALGRVAAQTLLDSTDAMARLRGKTHDFQGIPLMATYHPAALLRNPQWKRSVWEDVQKLRRLYDERVGDKPAWQPPKK